MFDDVEQVSADKLAVLFNRLVLLRMSLKLCSVHWDRIDVLREMSSLKAARHKNTNPKL